MLKVMQNLDRRYLYALLILAVALPFFFNVPMTVPATQSTESLYDKIESLPAGSFVLFGGDWSAGTRGENRPQSEVLIRHMMRKKLRFALIAFADPQGKTLMQDIAVQFQSQYGYREGVDWVNWGWRVASGQENFLKALAQDVLTTAGTDIHGAQVATLPVMQGIRTGRDFSLIIDVTGTASYQAYIQFLQGPCKVPMALGTTAVMAPEAFNYLDSGQLSGMLNGVQGAYEYEQKLGIEGRATRAGLSLSFAHLLIIGMILLGNGAMLMERRQQKRALGGRS